MIDKLIVSVFAFAFAAPNLIDKMPINLEYGIMRVEGRSVSNLPHAMGMTFSTLDEYLEHLRKKGAMDIPFYELQADGRYRLITGRGGNRVPPVYFTREELMQKFGFSQ